MLGIDAPVTLEVEKKKIKGRQRVFISCNGTSPRQKRSQQKLKRLPTKTKQKRTGVGKFRRQKHVKKGSQNKKERRDPSRAPKLVKNPVKGESSKSQKPGPNRWTVSGHVSLGVNPGQFSNGQTNQQRKTTTTRLGGKGKWGTA